MIARVAPLVVLVVGCGTYRVDLPLPEPRRAPIGELEPLSLELAPFEDDRPDLLRVGYQKNAYGMNVFDVLTNRPVTDLFRDAVSAELRANGHRVDGSSPLRVEAAVTYFWVEMQPALGGVNAVSTAACKLRLIDRSTEAVIFEQPYTGHYVHRGSSAFQSAYRNALAAALQRMVREIARDPELVAALRKASLMPEAPPHG